MKPPPGASCSFSPRRAFVSARSWRASSPRRTPRASRRRRETRASSRTDARAGSAEEQQRPLHWTPSPQPPRPPAVGEGRGGLPRGERETRRHRRGCRTRPRRDGWRDLRPPPYPPPRPLRERRRVSLPGRMRLLVTRTTKLPPFVTACWLSYYHRLVDNSTFFRSLFL